MKNSINIGIMTALFVVCVFVAPNLLALDGLSVQLGVGYNHDGMNMSRLILNGGIVNKLSPEYSIPGGQIIMSERGLKNSGIAKDIQSDGLMRGVNSSIGLRLDFFNSLFIRIDSEYETVFDGGRMEWQWENPTNASNIPSDGERSWQEFRYMQFAVPVTIGLNVPIKTKGKGNYNAYIGAGAAWSYGECSIEMNHPDKTVYQSRPFAMSMPGFHEEIYLSSMSVGFAWIIGLNAEIVKGLFLFMEYREINFDMELKSVGFKTSFLNQMASGTTNPVSPSIPAELSSGIIRVGLLYNVLSFSGR